LLYPDITNYECRVIIQHRVDINTGLSNKYQQKKPDQHISIYQKALPLETNYWIQVTYVLETLCKRCWWESTML